MRKLLATILISIIFANIYPREIRLKDILKEGSEKAVEVESPTEKEKRMREVFKKGKIFVVPPITKEYKDPRLSCLLSIFPGAGHFYLRKDLKGALFCLAVFSNYTLGGYYLYKYSITSGSTKKSNLIYGGVFMLIGGIIHAINMVEAYNDAIEINERLYKKEEGKNNGQRRQKE
jgi:hypothetical protein